MTTATATRVSTRPFWHALLACPQCRVPLAGPGYCVGCGVTFSRERSVPVLMSDRCRRTVSFEFHQKRSVSDRELARVLADPPRASETRDLPYHFDPAHALVAQQLPPGSRVLEIGCGGGQCRGWFARRGIDYVGTDISLSRVSPALQQHGGPDILADAHFLPFRAESFDMVHSAAVTEHLACPILMAQEVHRVLKPGGHFCSNVSLMEPWHDSSFYHMTPLGVHELLVAAGFEALHIWPGEDWGAFKAITSMAFAGPFRMLKLAGRLGDAVYRAQVGVQCRRRKRRGRAEDAIALKARVAGAIAWIAVRPNGRDEVKPPAGSAQQRKALAL